jgi:selenocysteine lyase/cysteine desulfurase
MLIAGLEHLHEWGIDTIQRYCADLTRDLLHEAQKLGFSVEAEDYRSAHLFGLRLPSHVAIDQLSAILDERNISVSLRGDAIRIAPHVYNDAADIDALRDALLTCVQVTSATPP